MKISLFILQSLFLLAFLVVVTVTKENSSSPLRTQTNEKKIKLFPDVKLDLDLINNIRELIQLSENPRQLLIDLQLEFEAEQARERRRQMEKRRLMILNLMAEKLTGTSLFSDFYAGRF